MAYPRREQPTIGTTTMRDQYQERPVNRPPPGREPIGGSLDLSALLGPAAEISFQGGISASSTATVNAPTVPAMPAQNAQEKTPWLDLRGLEPPTLQTKINAPVPVDIAPDAPGAGLTNEQATGTGPLNYAKGDPTISAPGIPDWQFSPPRTNVAVGADELRDTVEEDAAAQQWFQKTYGADSLKMRLASGEEGVAFMTGLFRKAVYGGKSRREYLDDAQRDRSDYEDIYQYPGTLGPNERFATRQDQYGMTKTERDAKNAAYKDYQHALEVARNAEERRSVYRWWATRPWKNYEKGGDGRYVEQKQAQGMPGSLSRLIGTDTKTLRQRGLSPAQIGSVQAAKETLDNAMSVFNDGDPMTAAVMIQAAGLGDTPEGKAILDKLNRGAMSAEDKWLFQQRVGQEIWKEREDLKARGDVDRENDAAMRELGAYQTMLSAKDTDGLRIMDRVLASNPNLQPVYDEVQQLLQQAQKYPSLARTYAERAKAAMDKLSAAGRLEAQQDDAKKNQQQKRALLVTQIGKIRSEVQSWEAEAKGAVGEYNMSVKNLGKMQSDWDTKVKQERLKLGNDTEKLEESRKPEWADKFKPEGYDEALATQQELLARSQKATQMQRDLLLKIGTLYGEAARELSMGMLPDDPSAGMLQAGMDALQQDQQTVASVPPAAQPVGQQPAAQTGQPTAPAAETPAAPKQIAEAVPAAVRETMFKTAWSMLLAYPQFRKLPEGKQVDLVSQQVALMIAAWSMDKGLQEKVEGKVKTPAGGTGSSAPAPPAPDLDLFPNPYGAGSI